LASKEAVLRPEFPADITSGAHTDTVTYLGTSEFVEHNELLQFVEHNELLQWIQKTRR
jgi:hypothetical protein